MKLSEAVKCYEECFDPKNPKGKYGCLYENCPLYEDVKIENGSPDDKQCQLTWKIEGCTLMAQFEKWLKYKKPGIPYPEEV